MPGTDADSLRQRLQELEDEVRERVVAAPETSAAVRPDLESLDTRSDASGRKSAPRRSE